jgi:hypothetical protein
MRRFRSDYGIGRPVVRALASVSLLTSWGMATWMLGFLSHSLQANSISPSALNKPTTPDSPTSRSNPSQAAFARATRPVLVNVAELAEIDFSYYSDGRSDRFFLPEIMGGGAAWLDYDGDGWLDLFVAQGCDIAGSPNDAARRAHLFRSQNGVRFVEVAEPAEAIDHGYGQGCCVGDIDNDGFAELYVTHYGTNRLLFNHGDGTFDDRTRVCGTATAGWSTSCAFGDLDRDGDLDLYVAHYVKTTVESNPLCMYPGPGNGRVRGYCGPASYEAERDDLFANQGDGTFRDITEPSGADESGGKGLAVVIADLNNDRWPDVYVANDMERNFLFWNSTGKQADAGSASPHFTEAGLGSGAGLTSRGELGASMGIGCGDWDHNGWLDLVVTNYLNQGANLYCNDAGTFSDRASGAQLFTPTLSTLGFGTVFFDFDNDGWLDVFITNGHVLGPLVGPPDRMRGQVFRNDRSGHFVELTDRAGPYFHRRFFGRGVAAADFTNSGATGLAVVHQNEPLALLRNDTPNRGHFAGLQFVGTRSNRCALNTRVMLTLGGEELILETTGGGSYLSDGDHRLMAGLGEHRQIDKLRVFWPSGSADEWTNVAGDRYWILQEGQAPRPSDAPKKR